MTPEKRHVPFKNFSVFPPKDNHPQTGSRKIHQIPPFRKIEIEEKEEILFKKDRWFKMEGNRRIKSFSKIILLSFEWMFPYVNNSRWKEGFGGHYERRSFFLFGKKTYKLYKRLCICV